MQQTRQQFTAPVCQITKFSSLADRLILLLPCLYIIFIPVTHWLPAIGMYNEKRFIEILLLIGLGGLLLMSPPLRQRWLDSWLQLPALARQLIIGVYILGLLSALGSQSIRHALLDVGMLALLFFSTLLIATSIRNSEPRFVYTTLIATITIAAMAYLALFVAGLAAASHESTRLLQTALFGNFAHLRFFGQWQSWTLALIVLPLFLIAPRHRLLFGTLLLVASGWWMLAFSSGTRGTLFGSLVAFALTAILYRQQAKAWFAWQGIAFVSGLLLYIGIFVQLPVFQADGSSTVLKGTVGRELASPMGRFGLWRDAWDMISAHPLLGAGPMHYACDLSHRAAHPHNTTLQLAAEWGLPAMLLIITLVLWAGFSWLRVSKTPSTANRLEQALPVALFAAVVTAAVHAQFSGLLIMPMSQVLLITIIGWMIGRTLSHFTPSGYKPGPVAHAGLIFILILSIILLLQGIIPDIFHLNMLEDAFQSNHHFRVLSPRFWQQGRICD